MKWLRRQNGDTLIEVTLALAILSMVLMGAFATANKAFLLGQDAKERSQLAAVAQQQAEALQSFRDSHSWNEFVYGNNATGMKGVSVYENSADCDAVQGGTQHCFHMVRQTIGGFDQWAPAADGLVDSTIGGGLSYVRILATPNPVFGTPTSYDFTIQYGVPARGGGEDLKNSMWLHLTNLDGLRR